MNGFLLQGLGESHSRDRSSKGKCLVPKSKEAPTKRKEASRCCDLHELELEDLIIIIIDMPLLLLVNNANAGDFSLSVILALKESGSSGSSGYPLDPCGARPCKLGFN